MPPQSLWCLPSSTHQYPKTFEASPHSGLVELDQQFGGSAVVLKTSQSAHCQDLPLLALAFSGEEPNGCPQILHCGVCKQRGLS